jgi:hypothetical protein
MYDALSENRKEKKSFDKLPHTGIKKSHGNKTLCGSLKTKKTE